MGPREAELCSEVNRQADPQNTHILAVGDPKEWKQAGRRLPEGGAVAFISFEQLNGELLAQARPPVVFSPVLSRRFDCIDLAILLHRLGFTGSYRAVAPSLPNPKVIEGEVRACCPNLDFQILLEG